MQGAEGKGQPQFKFWAKKQFVLVKIGEQQVLYSAKQKLPVVTFENLFERINECHTAVGHLGRDKTWHEVSLDGKIDFLIYFFVAHLRLVVAVLLYH